MASVALQSARAGDLRGGRGPLCLTAAMMIGALTSQKGNAPVSEDGWQATPAPPAPSGPRLIPVITTGKSTQAAELAQIYFQRWACQENSIRDWLIPVHLDTNHGYAKELVENSERTKRQGVL